MITFDQKKCFLFFKCFSIFVLTAIFILPISMDSIDLYSQNIQLTLLHPFSISFVHNLTFNTTVFHYAFFLLYIIPITVGILIASFFVDFFPRKLLYILAFLSLTIYLFCSSLCIVLLANTIRWFILLPRYIYVIFTISIICHAILFAYGIITLRNSNPKYAEYKKIESESDNINKKSIKTKLIVTVIGTIALILIIFVALILNAYRKLITEAVGNIGRAQAEQTAAVYDSAEGKYAKIAPFFETQKEANRFAESPYERIDIIISSKAGNILLEELDDTTELPDYDVFAYTTGEPKKIPDEDKSISSDVAKEYLRRYKSGIYKKEPVYNDAQGICKYIYPVTIGLKKGSRLMGFSIVSYKTEILMKAYFHTKVFVFVLAAFFLYFSTIIVFILSDYIANPLLFLRANVRKSSDTLSEMLSGNANITPENLTFEDTIKTKDEIQDLSSEINNMVSIIRGIIPYISFSTLKNADKDIKRSSYRELCFLFTDIRGFTTMCEGMSPRDVVRILNHYLDLETQIILNNGGDVDKFVGDEMMAFFSGPRKEYNACKAAIEIRAAMKKQQELATASGSTVVSIGIGINTGKVIFGSVGARTRMDFTSIGDTVNLAARLEGANKAYGSKSIITEAVYEKLQNTFICRELDFITVKGKTEPVRIYEILQESASANPNVHEIKELFEKGLNFYRKKLWDKAQEQFFTCAKKYNDAPSVVFLERIKHFKITPPPLNWDGVFVMNVK